MNFWASWCDAVREGAAAARAHPAAARRAQRARCSASTSRTPPHGRARLRAALQAHLSRASATSTASSPAATARTRYPETFVIDRDGRVAALRRGPVDQAWLDQNLPSRCCMRRRSRSPLALVAAARRAGGRRAAARLAARHRGRGHVRAVRHAAEHLRVGGGRPRARVHPAPDRRRARTRRRSSTRWSPSTAPAVLARPDDGGLQPRRVPRPRRCSPCSRPLGARPPPRRAGAARGAAPRPGRRARSG